jgi:hypothetical protein
MNPDTLVLLIPMFAMCIPIMAIWTKHQRQLEQMRSQSNSELTAQFMAQNHRLEERVRVLERILTDRSTDLAHQIDALRAEDGAADPLKKLQ